MEAGILPTWPIFSDKRFALSQLKRSNHMKQRTEGGKGRKLLLFTNPSLTILSEKLSDAVRAFVAEKVRKRPEGPIFLLTHTSMAGFGFNPVSACNTLSLCH